MILYLIRGLPGSGKSTYAKRLGCFHVEADMFFCYHGVWSFRSDCLSLAHDWCQSMVKKAMKGCVDIAVSNTFSTEAEIQPYLDLATKRRYEVKLLKMCGTFQSTHDVPERIIEFMEKRWFTPKDEILVYPESQNKYRHI